MKKFLLSLLCLFAVGLSAKAETKTYQLCTDQSEILNPDNQFVIVSAKSFTDKIYAVMAATKTGTNVAIKGAEVASGSTVPEEITMDVDALGLGLFSLKDNGDYKALYESTQQLYYGAGTSSTNTATVSSLPTGSGANQYQLNVTFDLIQYTVKMVSQKFDTRAFLFNNAGNFKNYAVSNLTDEKNALNYACPLFYKEVNVGTIDPEYKGYDDDGYTIVIGETMPFPSILPKELTYTYTTDDSNIIEIDNVNKTFKALSAGTATIKFATDAVEGKFNAGEGSFTISVEKIQPEMSFPNQVVIAKLGTGVVWQMVEITKPEGVLGDSPLVTYTSSNPDIVEIDEETGQIKPEDIDIHSIGTVEITATFTPNEEYSDYAVGTATYKIIVKDPAGEIEPSYNIFNFTSRGAYGMDTQSGSSSKYETKVKEIVGDDNTVTITFNGDYRSWALSEDACELRLQKNSGFDIEVPQGYKITKIGLVGKDPDKSSMTLNGTFTPTSGTISDKTSSEDLDYDYQYVWIPNDNAALDKVSFKNNGAGNTEISYIEVMYEAASSTLESADLSFKINVNGVIVDEEASINAVVNPYGRPDVTYSIDGLDDDQYTITPTSDGKSIKVLVRTTGYFTLRAVTPAGDGYRDGLAIMRLNVFRHLDVSVNGTSFTGTVIPTTEKTTVILEDLAQANVYYKLTLANSASILADVAEETDDVNQLPGFELYEDGIDIPAMANGTLEFYIANYGYMSPIRKLDVGVKSAVEEIEAVAVDGEVRYFDLSGREVKGQPEKGLYIRLKGGKAEKVIR
ncbi:MAG: hypothetical protein K2G53_09500 [Muribaculaceae bacterium]|nr:hypothetical protein [Muribaculaceae bacterium]